MAQPRLEGLRVLLYALFRVGAFLARYTPLRISYALARGAGTLAFYAWTGGRRRSIQNMTHVARGDVHEARRLARLAMANYAVYIVDFFRLTSATPAEVRSRVRFDGWHAIEAERRGNGVIFITCHFGNWDIGAAALAQQGFPVLAIADTLPNARINARVAGSREAVGLRLIPVGRTGPGILRALRDNNVLAIVVDIPASGSGGGAIEVEFFGAPIAVSDGPARIALRAGASIVTAVAPRVSPWSDVVSARVAPIRYGPTGDIEHDVQGLTQAIFAQLEEFIRLDPAQWYIFRNLWPADRRAGAAPVAGG